MADVYVERATIGNFRGIARLEVDLRPGLSLLVGRNNAGKSRILRALQVAVGGAPVERDDLTVGSADPAQIDIVIAPLAGRSNTESAQLPAGNTEPGSTEEVFSEALQRIFGLENMALTSEDPVCQRFAWRTTISATAEGTGARSQSAVMAHDAATGDWSPTPRFVAREARHLLYAELVDTRRDLDTELRQRGTAIRRLLNDLRVPEAGRSELEQQLAALGDDILGRSATLQSLRDSLGMLDRYVDSLGDVQVDPVPRTLEELARAVGVSFDDDGSRLASRLHGSGVRSLASLLIQDVFYRQTLGVDAGSVRPHPVTLIEEPEAHLHPHAILEIAGLLAEGERQVIATTHSPLLAASVSPRSLLLVGHSPDGSHRIVDFGPAEHDTDDTRRTRKPSFYASEMEKLTRQVERPFGELLFAKAIVIGEGATERAFLPPVLREELGPLAHGVSVIDSAGLNGPILRAALKFARHVDLPLMIFADGDSEGQERIRQLVDEGLIDGSNEVVLTSHSGSASTSDRDRHGMAVEKMLIAAAPEVCSAACGSMGEAPGSEAEMLAVMKRLKGTIGTALAKELIAARTTENVQWPDPLRRLFGILRVSLTPPEQR